MKFEYPSKRIMFRHGEQGHLAILQITGVYIRNNPKTKHTELMLKDTYNTDYVVYLSDKLPQELLETIVHEIYAESDNPIEIINLDCKVTQCYNLNLTTEEKSCENKVQKSSVEIDKDYNQVEFEEKILSNPTYKKLLEKLFEEEIPKCTHHSYTSNNFCLDTAGSAIYTDNSSDNYRNQYKVDHFDLDGKCRIQSPIVDEKNNIIRHGLCIVKNNFGAYNDVWNFYVLNENSIDTFDHYRRIGLHSKTGYIGVLCV